MFDVLIESGIVALTAAFIILLLKKWGAIEWLQVHGSNLVSQMANCDFCLSCWTSLSVAIALALCIDDWRAVFVSLLATPICRKLL
jgi:hypothetical protein